MKIKNLITFALSGLLTFGVITVSALASNIFDAVGAECAHTEVEEYHASAPTHSKNGLMHHFACCTCHTAWQDKAYKTDIGNTYTDRTKIDINFKTNATSIDKSSISYTNEIILADTSHVHGFDQTIWGSSDRGMGSGNLSYYVIDGKDSIRLSTETLTPDQKTSLDYSNFGYSEIGFNKKLTGTISASFEYKIYDLDVSKYLDESKVQAVWEGVDGKKYTTDVELITDNKWHKINVSSLEKITIDTFALKIHHFDGEIYISNLSLTASGLDFPVAFREGASFKWEAVSNAEYYIVHDNNNYPNEIRVDGSAAVDGILSYRPTAAGSHNIYVTAYDSDGKFDPASSNIVDTIFVEPVFFYDNMINKYEINKNAGYTNKQINQTYNSNTWNDNGDKYYAWYTDNGTFTKNESERLRFNSTEAGSNLVRIVNEAKELGTNILHVSHEDGYLSSNLESNAELKLIMDYAHANNLKVTVLCNPIYAISVNGTTEEAIKRDVFSYLKGYGKSLLEHPAFYGFALRDEPPRETYNSTSQSIERVSLTARAVLDYYAENYGAINFSCERPYFVCDLLQYGGTNIFHCEYDYENYIETWLRITGLDYFSTDIYTYTTQQQYGDNPDGIDINYNILMHLKKRYKNLKMHLTVTSNNDVFARESCNQYDIFGSTLYAAAMNNYGVSRYTYYPAMHTYHWSNGVVNRNGSHTSKYNWIKEAQAQFEFINDKLYDYEPVDFSYQTSGKYGDKEGWINQKIKTNTRRMDVTLSNGSYQATMVVNYNSQINNISTFSVNVPNGKIYYKFGLGETTQEYISTGGSVSLSNGTAILIMDASERQTLENINTLIQTAQSINVSSKENQAQFILLANNIEKLYSKLEPGMKARVKGYADFAAKLDTVDNETSILSDDSYTYREDTDEGSQYISFNEDSDPTYGTMYKMEWPEGKSGNIEVRLNRSLIGEDWSIYKSVGFFIRYSHAPTDKTYLIANNWNQAWIPATKKLVDAATNLYFYEFDLSTVTAAWTHDTYFQIYFNSDTQPPVNMTKIEISSLVKYTHNTDGIAKIINKALSLSTTSNRDLTQFTLLANRIDLALNALGSLASTVAGYNEYQTRKASLASKAVMLDDGSNVTTYEPGVSGDWPLIKSNHVASDEYGYFNSHTYQTQKNGGNCQFFYQAARGKFWKGYSRLGFFVQGDSPLYHQAYFHDGANHLFADPVVVDAENNIYYFEINTSNMVQTFSGNPFVCINLGGGAFTQTINITNIVGII